MKSYKDLAVYHLAYSLALDVHKMSMKLPDYELYEQGSQVRRSSKSIKNNIVEGFGRRRYENEFIKYLIYAIASCDECSSQLSMINELYFKSEPINDLISEYEKLGKMLNKFIQFVDSSWRSK